jgi:ribonuclease HII
MAARSRIHKKFEKQGRLKGFQQIAGVDEAGRGSLAGPVVAAACVFPENFTIRGINDSKQLTPEERAHLFQRIVRSGRVTYGVGVVSAVRIDEINILHASLEAMAIAVAKLNPQADYLLVDGPQVPHTHLPCQPIIDGDALSFTIAAASIIAKYLRDEMMRCYSRLWPEYGFEEHKGYGTKRHKLALHKFGPSPIHRMSFKWKDYVEEHDGL